MAWIKKTRDTGWRDITAWVPTRVSGRLLLKRTDLELAVALDELVLSVGGTVSVNRFPSGLRPLFRVRGTWFPSVDTGPGGSVNISGGGYCNVYDVVAGQAMSGLTFAYFDPSYAWPSPEPGDPV